MSNNDKTLNEKAAVLPEEVGEVVENLGRLAKWYLHASEAAALIERLAAAREEDRREIERLTRERDCYKVNCDARDVDLEGAFKLIDEAQSSEARLRGEIERLRAALEPFARCPMHGK